MSFSIDLSKTFKMYNIPMPYKIIIGCRTWKQLNEEGAQLIKYWANDNSLEHNQLLLHGILYEKKECNCDLCPVDGDGR